MILSVIIVNYQVAYFLELCLHSVRKALHDLDAEIIVVDNHSADGSLELLRPQFPEVKWIVNPENTGFAHANNLAFRLSGGNYLLFLNPDTLLPEDFARHCLRFVQSFTASSGPDNASSGPEGTATRPIGGLGVRMIDGDGHFLKESRRGFPTPWVAFCKLTGLTSLFPRSRRFSGYYLGHIPPEKTHPAPVLSGACLLISREALDAVGPFGPFDETFFLYAEDIDLCHRLEKAGFTNYYLPETTIIHFKGESTNKDIRYIRQFYKAMIQFRRKHFNTGPSNLFRFVTELALWLRAGLAAIFQPLSRRPNPSKGRRTWLTGDPAGIARIRTALAAPPPLAAARTAPSPKRTPATDELHADEIIYCIGEEYSFKSAIAALETKDPAHRAAFYFADGHAVIGSSHRNERGEIWIL
jgi:N-acetylglucosaminyl-diphospho-decaprenol L-rhamnosyltransferase